jgi:hypothetical protein
MVALYRLFVLLSIPLLLQGCGIGYNSALFFTRTNMGVDIDTKPPVAEISVSRQEGVIEPAFGTLEEETGAEEKTLPVLSSFKSRTNFFGRIFVGVGSSFATGKAAATMAEFYNCTGDEFDKCKNRELESSYKGLILKKTPKRKRSILNPLRWFGKKEANIDFLEAGYARPLFFGTHSTLGLKIEWSGETGQYPSALKFGYNRKQFAWAPITLSQIKNSENIKLDIPSVLATLDGQTAETNYYEYLQYFATGQAATNLALHKRVRKALINEIAPIEIEEAQVEKPAEDEK